MIALLLVALGGFIFGIVVSVNLTDRQFKRITKQAAANEAKARFWHQAHLDARRELFEMRNGEPDRSDPDWWKKEM